MRAYSACAFRAQLNYEDNQRAECHIDSACVRRSAFYRICDCVIAVGHLLLKFAHFKN